MSMHDVDQRESILNSLNKLVPQNKEVLIVCIGTDRSTGDALGPLIGSKLSRQVFESEAVVYGTLEVPVHAVNLSETLDEIKKQHPNHFVIAVDACLGQLTGVGKIKVAEGPLRPGAGVNKVLPEVGDIHITGIVNVGGFMEYFVLQNTRLSVVVRMADQIANALCQFVAGRVVVKEAAATNYDSVIDRLKKSVFGK